MGEVEKEKKRSRRKKGLAATLLDLGILLVLLAGLGIMLYPWISDQLNRRHAAKAMSVYEEAVGGLAPEVCERLWKEAREYNARLKENPNPYSEENRTPGYEGTLCPDESGIMGYVTIPKIRVRLPFYHGTEEEVLQTAIGHLEGSSLPTGDPGEHTVLSAHRGLPSAKLFTDLPELMVGDSFTLTVLDLEMTYRIDRILTVLPDSGEAFEALSAEEGKNYCTLMTCTPYGINTHRLLVRGHRVEE